ncbi:hypothetical protein HDU98_003067, partial [Podochytrium sp. JEL0797]
EVKNAAKKSQIDAIIKAYYRIIHGEEGLTAAGTVEKVVAKVEEELKGKGKEVVVTAGAVGGGAV